MKRFRSIAGWALVGSAACWLPSVLVHLWRGSSFSGRDVLILTILQPLGAIGLVIFSRFLKLSDDVRAIVPLAICAGLWILGPEWIAVNWAMAWLASPQPLVHSTIQNLPAHPWVLVVGILILVVIFPAGTFMMSTYDGTLGGVLLTSTIMTILWFVLPGRRIAPAMNPKSDATHT